MEGFGIGFVLVVAAMIALAGISMWMSFSMDRTRIESYVQQRGGRVISITWAPLGHGWFGEKNDRIYEVVYYDGEGNQHWATCKTSVFSGVYWTEDRVTHHKEKWLEKMPERNAPGDPLIRYLPAAGRSDAWVEEQAAQALADRPAGTGESLEEEIARLKRRLAELEARRGMTGEG